MKKKYLPVSDAGRLAHAAEECGELIAAIGKTLRFGLDSYNPELPLHKRECNKDWVLREIKDVRMAIDALERNL